MDEEMANAIPAGMNGFVEDHQLAMGWMASHPTPTDVQRSYLLENVFPEINHVLTVAHINSKQRFVILRNEIVTLEDLPLIGDTPGEIHTNLKVFNSLTENRGGTFFGIAAFKRLCAVTRWARDCHRRDRAMVHTDFTPETFQQYLEEVAHPMKATTEDKEVSFATTLTGNNFLEWEEGLFTKLRSIKGHSDVPLEYVIRRPLPEGSQPADLEDPMQRLIYETRHQGTHFTHDNQRVGNIIVSFLTGTPAMVWIKDEAERLDGRGIMDALRTHYLGASQITAITDAARMKYENAVYKSEATYSFEKVATDLKSAFAILDRYGSPVSHTEQIRHLRDKILTSNSEFNSVTIAVLESSNPANLEEAISVIRPMVTRYFQDKAPKRNPRLKISGVTPRDFANKFHNGRSFYNEIDISDFGRWYTQKELNTLPDDLVSAIMEYKQKHGGGGKGKGKGGSKRKDGKASTKSSRVKKLKARVKALESQLDAIKDGTDEDDNPTPSEAIGPNAQRTSSKKNGGKKSCAKVRISKLRHSSTTQSKSKRDMTGFVSYLDEDSHTDMHCAGKNCVVVSRTGYQCDVDPFLESYESTKNVDVVRAATAIQVAAHRTIYLIMHAALDFTTSMETSLFNGNLVRDAGTSVCTDPYDGIRALGILDREKGIEIPMERRENVIGLKTFCPDRDDVLRAMSERPDDIIYMNAGDEFAPNTFLGSISTGTEHIGYALSASEIDDNRDSTHISISPVYDQKCFVQEMEKRVQVVRASDEQLNTKVAAIVADKPHSGVNAERVSHIFGCGIETA